MEKTIRLKIAAMLLFWFGIVAQLITVFIASVDYVIHGFSNYVPFFNINDIDDVAKVAYLGFAHFIHITAAYWLSKGRKIGLILGLFISIYEIMTFLVPDINLESLHRLPQMIFVEGFMMPHLHYKLFTPAGFAIRVLFAVIIFLIVSGRKELSNLQSEDWRPWKNPFSSNEKSSK